MKLKAREISDLIQGELQGDGNLVISSFGNITNAPKGSVTFLLNNKYKKYINSTNASLIITPHINISTTKTIIKVDNPVKRFTEIIRMFKPQEANKFTISTQSHIHSKAKIDKKVLISEFCVIKENTSIDSNCVILPNTFIGKNVTIKSNCKIGPNVTIYDDCTIGENCIIHAGVVLGSDGFGFVQNSGELSKMPQTGKVLIGNNVEIGSNTTIDRGTFENTTIEDGVKLDNLIQIGHNVIIGKNTVIAAQCGIAGSTKIGKNCMLGGQVAIADHLKIGNNVKIAGKSGVIKNIKDNQIIQGPLAFEIKEFQKSYIHFKNLGKIVDDINQLKKTKGVTKNNKK